MRKVSVRLAGGKVGNVTIKGTVEDWVITDVVENVSVEYTPSGRVKIALIIPSILSEIVGTLQSED